MRNSSSLVLLAAILGLSACTMRPVYETEDWSVAVIDSDTAKATVRYEGFVCRLDSPERRATMAGRLSELAKDPTPSSPWTPRMKNATRKFLVENGSLVMVEQGEIPNPLSWFEQSGLNPATWFCSDVNMCVKDSHVIKRGFSSASDVVAASGQVMNERDYSAILNTMKTRDVMANTQDDWDTEGQTIIVWPGEARAFNWKVASTGYLKNWDSLLPYFEKAQAVSESVASQDKVDPGKVVEEVRSSLPEEGTKEGTSEAPAGK